MDNLLPLIVIVVGGGSWWVGWVVKWGLGDTLVGDCGGISAKYGGGLQSASRVCAETDAKRLSLMALIKHMKMQI